MCLGEACFYAVNFSFARAAISIITARASGAVCAVFRMGDGDCEVYDLAAQRA